jgi:hypothetical protein
LEPRMRLAAAASTYIPTVYTGVKQSSAHSMIQSEQKQQRDPCPTGVQPNRTVDVFQAQDAFSSDSAVGSDGVCAK